MNAVVRCPHCFEALTGDGSGSCSQCSGDLLPGWGSVATTCIAAAGARATGKSIFIAVMIKQLQHYATRTGMEIRPATRQIAEKFEEYYVRPLYQERGMMKSTGSAAASDAYQNEPLIFVMVTRDGRRHHLVIRDVAGEDLEHPENLPWGTLDFVGRADCLFFLYDPLKVPEIQYKLRMLVPEQSKGGDPMTVLNHTLDLVAGSRPRLAMIMSKFDAVQALRTSQHSDDWTAIMRNPGAGICRDPGPLVGATDLDGDVVHEEVRSLLVLLGAGALAHKIERLGGERKDGHRFFAVSALGHPPNGAVLHSRGIAPFRCLDPLRWALRGTGVM